MEELDINNQTELLKRGESLEERIWIDSNISKIDELLRINYDKSVEEFSEIILNAVADLIGSLRGAFYIVNDITRKVIAKAGYGCTLSTMEKKEFAFGDDLIGFAVKSKKMRYLKNLPINNAIINSGLAKVSSTSLIISPLIFNEVVYGVLELNNLDELDKKSLKVIDRLSRNIASTLQSIISNEKTKDLVKELQDRKNEMDAQEEELRQSIEELAATRDEMEKQKAKIEEYNEQLKANEEILKATILEVNEKNNQMEAQTEELRQNMEELETARDEMELQRNELQKVNSKIKSNSEVLQKALEKTKVKDAELKFLKNIIIKSFENEAYKEFLSQIFTQDEIDKLEITCGLKDSL